jgi:hypothetical protein
VNKRSIATTAALLAVGLIVGIGPAQAKAAQTAKKQGPPPITIRGGYINDLNCVPTGVSPTDDDQVYNVECTASSMWNGDLTGREVVHFKGTADTSARVTGTYEGVFVGTYAGDHSHGGLHTTGYFEVDENSQFFARATFTGTCDWAGSEGSFNADGFSINGGWVAQWKRPAVPPVADPTCNPLDGFNSVGTIS